MQKKKPLSARGARRLQARADAKLAADREKLTAFEPGGAPSRSIVVESASQIEPHAAAMRCVHCDTSYRVDEHTAEMVDGQAVRVARVRCAQCGARRVVYFQLRGRLLS